MKALQFELDVIEAAESLAGTLGKDPNHTVAAAVLDTRGRIHAAVNVYHFTGGRAPSWWPITCVDRSPGTSGRPTPRRPC